MKQRSPTLEGFRAILRCPSFGLAEIAWRWSFGAAAGLLLVFSFFEYLDTLPVSKGDLLLLRTTQPALISRAVLHIFRGSAFRVVETAVVLVLTLGVGWIVVASLARAATIRALLTYFRDSEISTPEHKEGEGNWQLRSLFALNLFRFGTSLAAAVGFLAAVLLGGAASRPSDPAPGSALLIILTVALLVWLAWSTLNWFLSLAAIFVVADGQDTFGAIVAAVDLCRTRSGSLFAAGTWFGLAHLTAFVVASSVVAFPLGFAAVLPAGVVLGGVLLVTLLYSAIADFLYIGRLAAYMAIVEMPESPSAEIAPPPLPHGGAYFEIQSSPAVDANELIP
ncbi:MAG TPA: hypothetical protein VN948_24165 [Terriglobales bacterium]|nr:hypothetical protein [Terriglobales bacterium]